MTHKKTDEGYPIFRSYLEEENDKPYYSMNTLSFYYEDMARKQKLIEGMAKAIVGYDQTLTGNLQAIEQQVAERFDQWDEKLKTFDGSVMDLLQEWVDDGTMDHIVDSSIVDRKLEPIAAQLAETDRKMDVAVNGVTVDSEVVLARGKDLTLGNRLDDVDENLAVKIFNLVTDGDFLAPSTLWKTSNAVNSTANGVLTSTSNGAGLQSLILHDLPGTFPANHKIYFRLNATPKSSDVTKLQIVIRRVGSTFLGEHFVTFPANGVPINLSMIGETTEEKALYVYAMHQYADTATANGKAIEITKPVVIDLTETFGAGKEPTKEEIDLILDNRDWFGGVSRLGLKLTDYTLNAIKKTIDIDTSSDVKKYGAVGDGVTNDTVAIQNAINSNRHVIFPSGVYLCDGVTIPSNTMISGAGIGNTVLKLSDSPKMALLNINGSSSAVKEGVTVENITLAHNKTYVQNGSLGMLLSGEYTRRILLKSVEFKEFNGSAVYVKMTDNNTTLAQGWVINQCVFRDGGTSSIGIFFDSEAEYNIVSNSFFHNVTNGVKLFNAANNGILNCTFLGGSPIHATKTAQNAGKMRVLGCAMNHTSGSSIEIVQSVLTSAQYGDQISNNEIILTNGYPLSLKGVRGAIVSNNRMQGGATTLNMSDNGTIVSDYNIVTNNILIGGVINNTSTGTNNMISNNMANAPTT